MTEKIGLIKNPLTIIAIFAGIAEVSGTIVLPFIKYENQLYFVWFLMIFPSLLVIIFFATLNFNHKVLYAPSDFQNEDNFFRVHYIKLSEAEKRKNLEEELSLQDIAAQDNISTNIPQAQTKFRLEDTQPYNSRVLQAINTEEEIVTLLKNNLPPEFELTQNVLIENNLRLDILLKSFLKAKASIGIEIKHLSKGNGLGILKENVDRLYRIKQVFLNNNTPIKLILIAVFEQDVNGENISKLQVALSSYIREHSFVDIKALVINSEQINIGNLNTVYN